MKNLSLIRLTTSTWVLTTSGLAIEGTYSEVQAQENYWPGVNNYRTRLFRTGRIRRCGGESGSKAILNISGADSVTIRVFLPVPFKGSGEQRESFRTRLAYSSDTLPAPQGCTPFGSDPNQ